MTGVRIQDSSDEELLARSCADPEAFGLCYDRFEREVLRFFMRAVRRADLAADLTAEVFACALAGAHGFDGARGTARAWLFGIAADTGGWRLRRAIQERCGR